jgi:hypothetical protein
MASAGFSNVRVSKSNCLYSAAPKMIAITLNRNDGSFIFFILTIGFGLEVIEFWYVLVFSCPWQRVLIIKKQKNNILFNAVTLLDTAKPALSELETHWFTIVE